MAQARPRRNPLSGRRIEADSFTFLFAAPHAIYIFCMRAFLALILFTGVCLAFAGCESELPPNPNATPGYTKLERGISGQGTLSEPDRSDDPIIKENTRGGN